MAEKRVLKNKHRIEMIMQEAGEVFEQDPRLPDILISLTTIGLTVNIRKQVFDLLNQSGDIFTWLMQRNSWTFSQAVRYLQKRPADSVRSVPLSTNNVSKKLTGHERKDRAPNNEEADLYTHQIQLNGNKTIHIYYRKPVDIYQEKALEVNGDKMCGYFSWKWEELIELRDLQYHRFTPVQDLSITHCDDCGRNISWHWKQKPRFELYPGLDIGTWQRRRVSLPEVFAYIVIDGKDEIVICGDCKRKHENFYWALDLLCKSAWKREAPERERSWNDFIKSEAIAHEKEMVADPDLSDLL